MSCVMSRPSSPPTERMKDARDFLYWLNHVSCTQTRKHTHTVSRLLPGMATQQEVKSLTSSALMWKRTVAGSTLPYSHRRALILSRRSYLGGRSWRRGGVTFSRPATAGHMSTGGRSLQVGQDAALVPEEAAVSQLDGGDEVGPAAHLGLVPGTQRHSQHLRRGHQVALCQRPNSGKVVLMNLHVSLVLFEQRLHLLQDLPQPVLLQQQQHNSLISSCRIRAVSGSTGGEPSVKVWFFQGDPYY